MPAVDLTEQTFDLVRYAGVVADLTDSEVIDRSVRVMLGQPQALPARRDPFRPIPVYGTYEDTRVEGEYVPATRRLTVTSAPLAGQEFRSPSGASQAVIAALNPARTAAQNNGWRFWHITETHQRLEVIRPVNRAKES